MDGRCAVQPRAHGNIRRIQRIRQRSAVMPRHDDACNRHMRLPIVAEDAHAGNLPQPRAQAIAQRQLVFLDFRPVRPHELQPRVQPRNAGQVHRTALVAVGQHVRLTDALAHRAGSAKQQRFRVHAVAQHKQSRTLRPQQPLVPRHGHHVCAQHVWRNVRHPGCLRRIHQQGNAALPADRAQLRNRLKKPRDVAGVGDNHQCGFAADDAAKRSRGQDAAFIRRKHMHRDFPARNVAVKQPHDGVVFRVGADDLVAAPQRAGNGEIQRFGAVCGEQNPLRMMHTQQPCGFLTAVLHHSPRAQSQPMPAASGIRPHLLLHARHRPNDLRRLREARRGIVQINHRRISSIVREPRRAFFHIILMAKRRR